MRKLSKSFEFEINREMDFGTMNHYLTANYSDELILNEKTKQKFLSLY